MKILKIKLITLIILLLALPAYAEYTHGMFEDNEDVKKFIDLMVKKHGFKKDYLESVFKETRHSGYTPKHMTNPSEKQHTWASYKKALHTEDRVQAGVKYYKMHYGALKEAEKKFGVSVSVILGIIGMETSYGRAPIRYRAIDTISTLAFYYPRRAEYFQRELEALLLFARKTDTDIFEIKSSYAGAIGIPQFMPSNVLDYAVSATNDKHIDIISNHADAIHSVASFLKARGFKPKHFTAKKVGINHNSKYKKFLVSKPCSSKLVATSRMKRANILFDKTVPNQEKGILFKLEGVRGDEYYAAFENFCPIFRYNPSLHYTMSVIELGENVIKLAKKEANKVKTKQNKKKN